MTTNGNSGRRNRARRVSRTSKRLFRRNVLWKPVETGIDRACGRFGKREFPASSARWQRACFVFLFVRRDEESAARRSTSQRRPAGPSSSKAFSPFGTTTAVQCRRSYAAARTTRARTRPPAVRRRRSRRSRAMHFGKYTVCCCTFLAFVIRRVACVFVGSVLARYDKRDTVSVSDSVS